MKHLAIFASAFMFMGASVQLSGAETPLRYGLEAPRSVSNVILLLTVDRMNEAGNPVEVIDFTSPETMSLALQNGDVDFVSTSAGTALSAIDAGFEAKAFMGSAAADFQMVARKEFTSCESLDGRRVAIQSREGTTGVLAINWFANACPDARPNIMIVPGSENRVAGLLANQLDASPVDMQNTAQLLLMRPDEFGIIDDFADSTTLVGSLYYASSEWLEANADAVKRFVSTYVDVLDEAKQNPTIAKEKLYEILPEGDTAVLDRVMEGWLDDVYIPVEGVQPEAVNFAIEFYGSVRPYSRVRTAEDVSTTDYLPTAD